MLTTEARDRSTVTYVDSLLLKILTLQKRITIFPSTPPYAAQAQTRPRAEKALSRKTHPGAEKALLDRHIQVQKKLF
jgi:hypothetical protein